MAARETARDAKQVLGTSPATSSGTFHSAESVETFFDSPAVSPPSSASSTQTAALVRSEGQQRATERTPLLPGDQDAAAFADRGSGRSMSLVFKNAETPVRASRCSTLQYGWRKSKPIFFFLLVLVFSVLFAQKDEKSEVSNLLCVCKNSQKSIPLNDTSVKRVAGTIFGPFLDEMEETLSGPEVIVGISDNGKTVQENMTFRLNPNYTKVEKEALSISKPFDLKVDKVANDTPLLVFSSNATDCIPISFTYSEQPLSSNNQVVIALVILIGVYVLIIFELVHRATAAMMGALAALSALAMVNNRPELTTVLTWIQWETLFLLFGMMILVGIFARTGFFDVVALKAYKLSRGHTWGLITLLCVCTALISAFLDNVTTILLLTPVTIRLCQVLNLQPTYVLIAEVIFSNIGGAATAIGDPPNVIIISHKDISKQIDFATFTSHLSPGIIVCLLVTYGSIRLLYWKVRMSNPDPPIVEEMKRQAEIWRRTAERMPIMSSEEKTVKLLLLHKTMEIENQIRNLKRRLSVEESFRQNLQELEEKYVITDWPLLIQSSVVITLVVALFFAQSFVEGLHLQIGWIAMMGAIALIVLADIQKLEELMDQVEWTTLVFFAGLFILMQALEELGLMDYLSEHTEEAIKRIDEPKRLTVALIAILWISALTSSFVDNIPFTAAMIPVILRLKEPPTSLPIEPLVWALALGACLGGNGTLIGASANVVCAGLAEQQGYPITFNKFFKIGFPVMLITTATAMGYLLVCQQIPGWAN